MIQSMTGYYSGEVAWQLQGGLSLRLGVEIKSLNSRFFELNVRLPPMMLSQENVFSGIFKQKLCRGKVFLTVRLLGDDVNFEQIKVNASLVKSYLAATKELAALIGVQPDLKVTDWLILPKIISFENEQFGSKDVEALAYLCAGWADALLKDRIREGSSIATDLEQSLKRIEVLEEKIFRANAKQQEELRHKLDTQKSVWNLIKEDEQRESEHAAQQEHKKYVELEILLEKSDIHEEVSRSSMHIQSIKNMLAASNYEVGKKLEFTLQELLRETNTISSKISNFEVNSSCVDIKFELEKIREQSQNIV